MLMLALAAYIVGARCEYFSQWWAENHQMIQKCSFLDTFSAKLVFFLWRWCAQAFEMFLSCLPLVIHSPLSLPLINSNNLDKLKGLYITGSAYTTSPSPLHLHVFWKKWNTAFNACHCCWILFWFSPLHQKKCRAFNILNCLQVPQLVLARIPVIMPYSYITFLGKFIIHL